MMLLSREDVRHALLAAQGLLSPPEKPATKEDIRKVIQRMGYLQIDTIQAVRRSQYLVLWARLGAYETDWLDEIFQDRKLFEYYAHALCYIPMSDYPIYRGLMLSDKKPRRGWKKWADQHPEIIAQVLTMVSEHGPMRSLDFKTDTIPHGWGNIKNEKLALNYLFEMGELMVTHREKFRRFFDLRERVLPKWDDADAFDPLSAFEALALKAIYGLGVAREDWIAPYFYLQKTPIPDILSKLYSENRIIQARVEGWETPVYLHRDRLKLVEAISKAEINPTLTTLLSPFDPVVSDRERALFLFNFDYRLEAYIPAKDRVYGYFSLPILHQGQLVGRLDPKAHRKKKIMEIKKIILEPGVKVDQPLVSGLKNTLADFSSWHQMTQLEINETDPQGLREALLADD
jgi:uncharacterized protein YcaQ